MRMYGLVCVVISAALRNASAPSRGVQPAKGRSAHYSCCHRCTRYNQYTASASCHALFSLCPLVLAVDETHGHQVSAAVLGLRGGLPGFGDRVGVAAALSGVVTGSAASERQAAASVRGAARPELCSRAPPVGTGVTHDFDAVLTLPNAVPADHRPSASLERITRTSRAMSALPAAVSLSSAWQRERLALSRSCWVCGASAWF